MKKAKIFCLFLLAFFSSNAWAQPAVVKQIGTLNCYNNILYANILPEANQTQGVVSTVTIDGTNLLTDPSFTSSTDYSILSTSVAINGGTNSYNTLSTDISGLERISGSIIDKGAFELTATSLDANKTESVTVFQQNGQITVNRNSDVEGMVSIYNTMGQRFLNVPTTGSSTLIDKVLGTGVYLVKLNVKGVVTTSKVILN